MITELHTVLVKLISETNGVSLADTLELASRSMLVRERPAVEATIAAFRDQLFRYQRRDIEIDDLLSHPVATCLAEFFRAFPQPYREEHIHLTGSLSAEFIYPRLMALLDGPNHKAYEAKLISIYGEEALPISCADDVDRLVRMRHNVPFSRYLQLLTLPKLVLIDRQAHEDAAYHLASTLYRDYNVGRVRLKFSISRASSTAEESLPGDAVSPEDVILGLHEGFARFRREEPQFDFILSPSFRKEAHCFDAQHFPTKKAFFASHVATILDLIERYPFLRERLTDVDTVGDEREHYRKADFAVMRDGFRKLQFYGFNIRSHHGETWHVLRHGVQAVDNAMNIWQIDTLEHGISLGVNPNYYFHMVFENAMAANTEGRPVAEGSRERAELRDMDWASRPEVLEKLLSGTRLNDDEIRRFIKTKFHTAREVERYQHDVLNRMIDKNVSLVALPSSNIRLTQIFSNYKDHPFSWWEKKGVRLGVGTDNYVTLNTNFIREMLILLCSDFESLKITKLLMLVTGESRRPYMSRLLWSMRG